MRLPGAAFAVYWTLRRDGLPDAREAAERMAKVFAAYPHWQVSEKQAREVRTELYKVLLRPPAADPSGKGPRDLRPTYDVTSVVARILKVVEQAEG